MWRMSKSVFLKQAVAEYLKLADHFVFSPGGDNRNNYANVEEIVNHAVEKGVR